MELSEYILGFLCVLSVLYLWQKWQKSKKGSLPGPSGLPLLGNVLQIGYQPHLKFMEWSKTYGPIFGIKMGMQEMFVVGEAKLIKELLSDSASAGRMLGNPIIDEFSRGPNHGVLNSEGAIWEQQRRFTVKTLRSLGFAKTAMESMIMEEVQAVLQYFRNTKTQPVSGNRLFNTPVINSLWRMVSGERSAWEEGRSKIQKAADEFFPVVMRVTTNGLMFAPVLRFIAPELMGWNTYLKKISAMFGLFEESIEKHKETFDENYMRDYIDHFLLEVKNTKDPESSFHQSVAHEQLVAGMMDLFIAGSESTSTSLSWALLYLSINPKIQERMHKEIDNALGSRLATLEDKSKLPYVEALYSEILRITTIIPLGVPHRMVEDKHLHGYFLKKGTPFFTNLYAVHHDKNVWGDPEVFRPERFLNEDGTKYVKNPALIPFSDGKRYCIGEQVARDTALLFLTSIVQQFEILPEDPKCVPDLTPTLGLVLLPKPFKIIMSPRKL